MQLSFSSGPWLMAPCSAVGSYRDGTWKDTDLVKKENCNSIAWIHNLMAHVYAQWTQIKKLNCGWCFGKEKIKKGTCMGERRWKKKQEKVARDRSCPTKKKKKTMRRSLGDQSDPWCCFAWIAFCWPWIQAPLYRQSGGGEGTFCLESIGITHISRRVFQLNIHMHKDNVHTTINIKTNTAPVVLCARETLKLLRFKASNSRMIRDHFFISFFQWGWLLFLGPLVLQKHMHFFPTRI